MKNAGHRLNTHVARGVSGTKEKLTRKSYELIQTVYSYSKSVVKDIFSE